MAGQQESLAKRAQPIRPRFDLIDLVLFTNVAERESLTRGAADTALSLAAASVRIRSIEQSIGADLFLRTKKGVQLTAAGRVFRRGADDILRSLQLLHDNMQEVLNARSGHVRVVANVLAVTDVLPNVIGEYLKSHPDVTVDLEEALSHDIAPMVRQGKADIGIAIGEMLGEAIAADELDIFPYRPFHWVLVVPKGHPLAGSESVSLADTLAYDFVVRHAESSIFTVLDSLARSDGQSLKLRAKLGSFDGVCRMVAAGVGISVVPRETALRHALSLEIAVVDISDEWARRQMQICVRHDWAIPPFARDFLDLLVAGGAANGDADDEPVAVEVK